jgi:hypothetical protein
MLWIAWTMVILTVYNVFMLPIPAFFDPSIAAYPAVIGIDYLVDVFFIFDLILTFYTAFENEWGKVVKDRRVYQHYNLYHGRVSF